MFKHYMCIQYCVFNVIISWSVLFLFTFHFIYYAINMPFNKIQACRLSIANNPAWREGIVKLWKYLSRNNSFWSVCFFSATCFKYTNLIFFRYNLDDIPSRLGLFFLQNMGLMYMYSRGIWNKNWICIQDDEFVTLEADSTQRIITLMHFHRYWYN